MDDRANTEMLLGTSPLRRLLIFALAPIAVDALLYGICLLFGFDPLSAAVVAKTALIAALFAGLAGGLLVFSAQGRAAPSASWEIAMRVLLASAFVGLLAVVFGTGYLLVVTVLARHGAALVATALVIVFAVGVLAYLRSFAARAFAIRAEFALPAAVGQAVALALIGFAAAPATDALIASCAAGLLLTPFLLFTKPKSDHPE